MANDFATLKMLLVAATREHYQRYRNAHLEEAYYGYSLYTNDDVSSIGPVATVESSVTSQLSDPLDAAYRYGPHQWGHFDDFGLFDDVNKALKSLYASFEFSVYRKLSLEAAFQALRELEADGLFGPRSDNRFVVLWVADSADPIMEVAAEALNSPAIFEAYSDEYASGI
jgi:hypothetical protein